MLPDYDPAALDRVVRRVANDSAGLPLLAVELLRAVALGLDLGTISGAWPAPLHTLDQSLPGEPPDVVITAIRIAARRLAPTAQRVLAGAAVLGDLATPPVLERALGLTADEVGRALDELEWHRWLTAEPQGLLVRGADRSAGGGAGHGDRRSAAAGTRGCELTDSAQRLSGREVELWCTPRPKPADRLRTGGATASDRDAVDASFGDPGELEVGRLLFGERLVQHGAQSLRPSCLAQAIRFRSG